MALSDNQKFITNVFMQLPQPLNKVQCMHVYIDGSLRNFRTKDITLPKKPESVEELPEMEFCGSATDFDVGNLADYYARPVKFYRDPFRKGDNTIVYCETYCREGLPTFANNRYRLLAAAKNYFHQVNQFTFHQPFSLFRTDEVPLTHMQHAFFPDSRSGFVCGDEIAKAHHKACLYAGVNLTMYEPITNQGQWMYSIGPGTAIDITDDICISRFILIRIAEDFGVSVKFGNWLDFSSLKPIEARLNLVVDNLSQIDKQRTVDELISKLVIREGKPVKVALLPEIIQIASICGEFDPYTLLTKVMEALKSSLR
ncbi:glutamine synthetase [Parasteatoda tepidariorum]|uniref:glutamine synthetase n=1 Tax=Parasteatoda tepidariorum TaxID=114398 RepID=UPI00077FC529|nr:glutamine synthetase [Parasteatoda tepidariorum]